MIEVRKTTDKDTFERFNLNAKNTLFLQSWLYGELEEKTGEEVFRVEIYDTNKLIGVCQVLVIDAKRGKHLFCPYGPVLKEYKKEYVEALVTYLKKIGKEMGCTFIRVSPFIKNTQKNAAIFKELGFLSAPMHVVAETTWLLDLTQSEDEILKNMRKTNRNLIKRAEKDGVSIKKTTERSAVEEFTRLHQDTKKKHDFTPYPDDFFRGQVDIFKETDQVLVLNAEYKNEIIGSAIVMYYGNMAAYHHGANSLKHRKIPAAYLIQWEAIKEAKKRGMKIYNFWGVSPDKDKPHPIAGVSHFKRGFGGYQYDLLHAMDAPINLMYAKNWIVETLRRKKRGYYFKKPE